MTEKQPDKPVVTDAQPEKQVAADAQPEKKPDAVAAPTDTALPKTDENQEQPKVGEPDAKEQTAVDKPPSPVPEVVVPAKPVQPIRVTPKPKPLRELKDISFVHIKRELENIKSTGGDSLYEHVQKVFKHMILHNPEKALERFEEISYMIKNGIEPSEFLKIEDSRSYRGAAGNCTDYVEKMAPHFAQGEPDEEGNIPQADPLATSCQDLLSESKIWQWAGIGFGEAETYRLAKSIKKLAASRPHKAIRFFGKIYGTEQDYYILEAQGEGGEDEEAPAEGGGEGEEGEPDPKLEARGTGVNELTYYVSHNALADWKRLPDLSYKDLIMARQTKVLFTGNLERQIFTNPFFFGKEKQFLRAQLSRMVHSTTIQPKGVMKLEEDEGADRLFNVVPNEGEEDKPFVMPTTKQMSNADMWVYARPNILGNGRTSHIPPEDPGDLPEGEEFDAEEAKKTQEASDPYEPLLKSVTADAGIKTGMKFKSQSWNFRTCGDPTEYRHENPAVKEPQSSCVVVARSLVWPGSYCFFYNGKVQQIYLGHGHKFCHDKKNFPVNPPVVMDDPEEYEDGPEPTPLTEPVKEEEKPEGEEDKEDEDDE